MGLLQDAAHDIPSSSNRLLPPKTTELALPYECQLRPCLFAHHSGRQSRPYRLLHPSRLLVILQRTESRICDTSQVCEALPHRKRDPSCLASRCETRRSVRVRLQKLHSHYLVSTPKAGVEDVINPPVSTTLAVQCFLPMTATVKTKSSDKQRRFKPLSIVNSKKLSSMP